MCAALSIAEVEVPVEALDPDEVHTPGIFVSRVVTTTGTAKPIEIITNRPLTGAGHAVGP
jgi:3-oxoacid CoA-transferase subunit A